jgi:hypothetical protein
MTPRAPSYEVVAQAAETHDVSRQDGGMEDVVELVERLPEGWSQVFFEGRAYGVTRRTAADGRSISVYAEELGGTDVVSANVYRTTGGDLLKPCEMPAEKVLAFLRDLAPER